MDTQKRFEEIYRTNEFQGSESISGPGSSLESTVALRPQLIKLFKEYKVKQIIDAPCGDFNWMKLVLAELPKVKYLGLDIVPDLIKNNREKYTSKTIDFLQGDITSFVFPKADILLCRDCLVHLSYESVFKFLKNFVSSEVEYLLTTTFTGQNRKNFNFADGTNWIPTNLCSNPYNLTQPILLINEHCQEGNGGYTDKCLALWSKEQLKKCGI